MGIDVASYRVAAVLLLALAIATPAADAHARSTSSDGKVTIVVGHLNEPITTYVKSGLDLRFTHVGNATPVLGAQNTLTAVLVAPDNTTTLESRLEAQFGKDGSYTLEEPYFLTQPGQYRLRLTGTAGGSDVSGTYSVASPVPAQGGATFPDTNVPSNAELQDRLARAEARIAQLESQAGTSGTKPAPGLALPLTVALLGLVALVAVRRP